LYQSYLPTNAVRAPLTAQLQGFKELSVGDPFGNLLVAAAHIADADADSAHEG
jgi:hypothetical protein